MDSVRRSLLGLALCLGMLLSLVPAVANAGPRNLKEYCISGVSTGATWGWTVQDAVTFAVLATASGLSQPAGNNAASMRDVFVSSLGGLEGAPPYLFARAATSSLCVAPDAAFLMAGQDDFDLLVTASGSGTPTIVGPAPTGTVNFNPDIFLVPEPSVPAALLAGAALIGRLRRRGA